MKANRNTIFNFQFSIFNWRAQSLIEVVVAMAVITGLAIALVTMSLFSQKTAREATNTTQASKLAQENIEQVRIFRDRQGYSAFSSVSDGCHTLGTSNPDPSTWSFSPSFDCLTGTGETKTLDKTDFYRKIKIESVSATKKVTVTVSWTDSSGTQKVTNTTLLSAGP